MTKAGALLMFDILMAAGYQATVHGHPSRDELRHAAIPESYRVETSALHYDTTDLRALCDLAEGVGLRAVVGGMGGSGTIQFVEPDPRPKVAR